MTNHLVTPLHTMTSSSDDVKNRKKSKKKHKHVKKKKSHKRSRSSPASSDSSSDFSALKRKKAKKHKTSKKKNILEKEITPQKTSKAVLHPDTPTDRVRNDAQTSEDLLATSAARTKGPMTKEEWDKQQSVVRRVFDPDTQRTRLVRGSGEVIEEIVSRDRHIAINKAATAGDGANFQFTLGLSGKK